MNEKEMDYESQEEDHYEGDNKEDHYQGHNHYQDKDHYQGHNHYKDKDPYKGHDLYKDEDHYQTPKISRMNSGYVMFTVEFCSLHYFIRSLGGKYSISLVADGDYMMGEQEEITVDFARFSL